MDAAHTVVRAIFCRNINWQEVVMSLIVKGLAFIELFYWLWLFVSRAGHVHDCLPGAVGATNFRDTAAQLR